MDLSPIATSLLYTLLVSSIVQVAFYIPSAILKTEKYYDFSGALTYIACIVFNLVFPDLRPLSYRQIIAATFTLIWCTRLGFVLFKRVLRTGEDKRFEKLKQNPVTFFIPFLLQIMWCFLTPLAVYIILGNPGQPGFYWSDVVGIFVWVFGFFVEVLADYQKNAFKTANPNDFVYTGVWKYSRYANYFGEVTLHTGMWIFCAAGFVAPEQFASIISPVFTFCLIYFVSGVRLLEESSKKKYGARQDFQEYVRVTSKFILWFPKKSSNNNTVEDVENV